MKQIRNTLVAGLLAWPALMYADASSQVGKGINATGLQGGKTLAQYVASIANILIFIVGAIAVIMVIVGALRMVLSAGNPANVKAARETVLYALIGVGVAIASYAIVNFVVVNIK